MEFLKFRELNLNNSDYLISASTGQPLTNKEFVEAQVQAALLIAIAKECKGKTFKQVTVTSFEKLVTSVQQKLAVVPTVEYQAVTEIPTPPVVEKLMQYGEDFYENFKTKVLVDKINQIMQPFNILEEIETRGGYFSICNKPEELVKLTQLYTIREILEAAKIIANIEQ